MHLSEKDKIHFDLVADRKTVLKQIYFVGSVANFVEIWQHKKDL